MKRIRLMFQYTLPLALFGFAFAQPSFDDPSTWFASPDAVVVIGGIIGTFVVNFLTSIGKNVGGAGDGLNGDIE